MGVTKETRSLGPRVGSGRWVCGGNRHWPLRSCEAAITGKGRNRISAKATSHGVSAQWGPDTQSWQKTHG